MAISIPLITTFDAKGINRAITQFKRLDGGVNKSAFVLKNLNQATNNAFRSVARVGAGVALGAGLIGKALVTQAMEAKRVTAETNAIIKATGGAARISAQGVADLSDKLSMQIGVDDELIQSSANLLLTFKQVQNQVGEGNDIFSRAVTTAQDLGSVFGSADSAAMQLGKALSDPIAGITALRRAGINFTSAQKEQIKTLVQSGQTLEAQKLILDEVESQVGGTASATATDFGRMQVAVENVAEQLGALLLPYLEDFANFVTTTIVPILTEFATTIGEEGLGGGIKFLGGEILNFFTNLEGTGAIIYGIVGAFIALKVAIVAYTISSGIATIATTAFGLAWNATGIGLVISAIAVLITVVVLMAVKFQWFRDFLKDLWNGIVKFMQGYINSILDIYEFFINAFIKGVNILISGFNRLNNLWGGTDIDPLKEVNFELNLMGALIDTNTKKFYNLNQSMYDAMRFRGGANSSRSTIPYVSTTTPTLPTYSSDAGGGSSDAGGGSSELTEEEKRLEKLIAKLKDLKKQMAEYKKGLRDAFNIKLDADTSKGSALTQTRNTLSELKEFKSNIKRLQARGVGSAILKQVADAGLFGGNSLAKDILNMSDLDFREFKAGQREIRKIAGQTANILGEDLYGDKITTTGDEITTAENNVIIASIDWDEFGKWLASQTTASAASAMTVQEVNITMPAGSNGDDVVKALQNYNRRKGAIPIVVNNDRGS